MVGCWYFGAVPVLWLMKYVFESSYVVGEDASIAYGIGSFVHETGLSFLKKRLAPDDVRLAPVMVQTAVLFNAQANYKAAEPYYLKAKEIYEANLNRFQKQENKVAVEKVAQEIAQLALDYSSLLELTGRHKDVPALLTRTARLIDEKGFSQIAASLSKESAKYQK